MGFLLLLAALVAVAVLAQPPPSCALNNGTPCAAAPWPGQWSLAQSTCCYPNNPTGYFVPPATEPWGLIPVSWTNAQNIWGPTNTCEAAMREGCRLVKAVNPLTRCFRYNNMELALGFLESNQGAIRDPSKKDWFLQYRDPATGAKNGTLYWEGQSLYWDYSVPAVRDYVVELVVNGTMDDVFDGTFTDDEIGFPVEHEEVPAKMGMTTEQVAEVRYWAQVTSGVVIGAIRSIGKYAYQAFFDGSYDGGNVGPAPKLGPTCVTFMREYCNPSFQNVSFTMLLDINSLNQTLAAFLVVRGPIAYVGFGWASGQETWRPEFLWAVGEPLGLCAEVSPGVFSRAWTYGNATLDCNTWKGTVPAELA